MISGGRDIMDPVYSLEIPDKSLNKLKPRCAQPINFKWTAQINLEGFLPLD